MDTLTGGPIDYTISTVYTEENPEDIIGYRISSTCGCIPRRLEVYSGRGLLAGSKLIPESQNLVDDSIFRLIADAKSYKEAIRFLPNVRFTRGNSFLYFKADTPEGNTVQDTFSFFVPDSLGY